MIVVHSSAVLMLLTNQPGANAAAAKLVAAEAMMSPVSTMDVLVTLSQHYADPSPVLSAFLRQSRIGQRPVDSAQTSWARQGFLTYGAGRWTLADSFAYGAAKAFDAPILCTTDIYANSDIRLA